MRDATCMIDWGQTHAHLNFYCYCGAEGHLESFGANNIRCIACRQVYRIPSTINVYPITLPDDEVPMDIETVVTEHG